MNQTSRTCVVAAMLVMAGVIVGCGALDNPTRPTQVANGGTDAASPSAHVSSPAGVMSSGAVAAETFSVAPALPAVRAATAKFHDISSAYAAGYTTQFEPCVAVPGLGAMGVHARKDALMADQQIDPLQPELLLYEPRTNGGYRLVGVEYFQVVLLRDPATNQVDKWLSPDPWPANYEVVTPTPQLFGQSFNGPMPGHTPTMGWHWDLHVWVWAHNPSGMFAEWNPSIQCP